MISVEEAKQIVSSAVGPLPPQLVPLAGSGNRVLAENIYAAFDLPAFDQSNVDGYAINIRDAAINLPIIGEIAAGDHARSELRPQTAIRIFTGAPVPNGADTVVMQEKTSAKNDSIVVRDDSLVSGMNVRPKGADIKKGALAMEAGNMITPAAMGYLASVGTPMVNIYPPPSVSIIITGKELVPPGAALASGQVFESGSFILRSALQQHRVTDIQVTPCDDSLDRITTALEQALQQSDLVLLTGGVSVGDYDFVSRAAENCGVTTLFHRVKQRPGKPLYFGMKDRKPVFGLPGNPSSVLTCFYEYVVLALNIFSQVHQEENTIATLTNNYKKPAGLTHFLKGIYNNGKVVILSAQESYRMSSFARSNCLVILPEDETDFQSGYRAQVHLL